MSLTPTIIGDAVLYLGDCREVLKLLPDNSVDSIVTDPPYELGFMGKSWDSSGIAYDIAMWAEAMRVLKPGGYLLAFSHSRTYHRMACAIEDAGFDIRDQIGWLHGQGFPKNLDVSKAIDKAAGAERKEIGRKYVGHGNARGEGFNHDGDAEGLAVTEPATDDAKTWAGWGTALKPAHEPICMARKPFEGTVVANVLKHGTGAINIDACRIGSGEDKSSGGANYQEKSESLHGGGITHSAPTDYRIGRWPANIIHDGSDDVINSFPEADGQQGDLVNNGNCSQSTDGIFGGTRPALNHPARIETNKNAARFFYCAKATIEDRNEGLYGLELKEAGIKNTSGRGYSESDPHKKILRSNNHPTVKPIQLMRYLVKLVTPPQGTVMDLFMGSGSTGKAAWIEGFKFIGIEQEPEYFNIAKARVRSVPVQEGMFA